MACQILRAQTLGPSDLAQCLDVYARGQADVAVAAAAAWAPERVEAEVRAILPSVTPARKVMLGALLTEAGLRAGTFARLRPDVVVITGSLEESEPYFRTAYRIFDESCDADPGGRLSALCRSWFRLASRYGWNRITVWLEKHAPRDPAMLTLVGARYEYWAGPDVSDGPVGFMAGPFYGGERARDLISTSHGRFSRASFETALKGFDQAIAIDPSSREAKLRRGHVHWLQDRTALAVDELEAVLREARAADDEFTGYLAGLFLGLIHEQERHFDAAIAAYKNALEVLPMGRVARIALGRLQLIVGADRDGWVTIRQALEPESAVSDDPWYHYVYDSRPWRLQSLILTIRELARQ